jgi:hypothetical protein
VFNHANPVAVMAATTERGLDLVVDHEHQSESEAARLAGPVKAAGWVRELRADATGIWGRMVWTRAARQMIGAREYRHVSPTMIDDQATTRIVSLRRVGLVHQPALPLKALARAEAPGTMPAGAAGTPDAGMAGPDRAVAARWPRNSCRSFWRRWGSTPRRTRGPRQRPSGASGRISRRLRTGSHPVPRPHRLRHRRGQAAAPPRRSPAMSRPRRSRNCSPNAGQSAPLPRIARGWRRSSAPSIRATFRPR